MLELERLGDTRPISLPPGPSSRRDVWVAHRLPEEPLEAALAFWALETAAAVVIEPGPLHPDFVLWARPSVLSGEAAELHRFFGELPLVVPAWRRRIHLSRRLRRLRVVVACGPDRDLLELAQVLRFLPNGAEVRVLPFPPAGC